MRKVPRWAFGSGTIVAELRRCLTRIAHAPTSTQLSGTPTGMVCIPRPRFPSRHRNGASMAARQRNSMNGFHFWPTRGICHGRPRTSAQQRAAAGTRRKKQITSAPDVGSSRTEVLDCVSRVHCANLRAHNPCPQHRHWNRKPSYRTYRPNNFPVNLDRSAM
eukprot:SAG31_NODE_23130_length_510_cov_1.265207_1_plen_161_part_10